MRSTKNIATSVLARDQKINQLKPEAKSASQITTACPSIGAKELALWPFTPVCRHMLPGLHIILGVGNKVMNNFWDFIHGRVKNIPHELIKKQNMTIIVHVTLKRLQEELEKF